MVITKKELDEIIEPRVDVEKVSTISSDGKALLIRIPKDVAKELNIQKGDKLNWFVNRRENKINLIASGAQVSLTGSNISGIKVVDGS